ncbi:MAG: hypothetical protein HYW78_01325 [Parcubacteria group bacterium]|nr:hypothetical protein [Parcubacteria group bacterium]
MTKEQEKQWPLIAADMPNGKTYIGYLESGEVSNAEEFLHGVVVVETTHVYDRVVYKDIYERYTKDENNVIVLNRTLAVAIWYLSVPQE